MNIIVKPYGNDLCQCRPDTTWERENRDFYSPECVNEIFWTPVVFARVSKAGKCVGRKFVERYYDGVGCGMLMYCATDLQNVVTEVSGDPRPPFSRIPPSRGWHVTSNLLSPHSDSNEQHVDSGHQTVISHNKSAQTSDTEGRCSGRKGLVSCVDRTSVLPMPMYNPAVLENDGNGYRVEVGCENIPDTQSCHDVSLIEAKDLLEAAICNASELISLRIGDFVAVELEATKGLASRENGEIKVKGTFCENVIYDFKLIF